MVLTAILRTLIYELYNIPTFRMLGWHEFHLLLQSAHKESGSADFAAPYIWLSLWLMPWSPMPDLFRMPTDQPPYTFYFSGKILLRDFETWYWWLNAVVRWIIISKTKRQFHLPMPAVWMCAEQLCAQEALTKCIGYRNINGWNTAMKCRTRTNKQMNFILPKWCTVLLSR